MEKQKSKQDYQKRLHRDFPDGPMVKTSPSSARGVNLIPGLGAKIPYALWPKKKKTQNIKQKQYCNRFNKDFKNGRMMPLSPDNFSLTPRTCDYVALQVKGSLQM